MGALLRQGWQALAVLVCFSFLWILSPAKSVALEGTSPSNGCPENLGSNPLLTDGDLDFGAFPFDQIEVEHFLPALQEAITEAEAKLQEIAQNTNVADFTNTILAYEKAGVRVSQIARIFDLYQNVFSQNVSAIEDEFSQKLTEYETRVLLNKSLFEQIKLVYEEKDELDLSPEDELLLVKVMEEFQDNGISLRPENAHKLVKVNNELSELENKFRTNVQNDTKEKIFTITDESLLNGLPESTVAAARSLAKELEEEGLSFKPDPVTGSSVLTYADSAQLRETMYWALGGIAFGGRYDNTDVAKKMVQLTQERARILGFSNFAKQVLKNRMAESEESVGHFLENLVEKSRPAAERERQELVGFKKQETGNGSLEPWDVAYWAEKMKAKKWGLDGKELRKYFPVDKVLTGLFKLANRLYGLEFVERTDLPKYDPLMKIFEVRDADGEVLSLLYMDMYKSATKRNGAWMADLRPQSTVKGKRRPPLIGLFMNEERPVEGQRATFSHSMVKTLFHEFGHGLHGMASNVKYTRFASPNIYWDVVEFPSQFMENWLYVREVLNSISEHVDTGEPMPQELFDKFIGSRSYRAATAMLRQLSFGLLDFGWYTSSREEIKSVSDFEWQTMAPALLQRPPAGVSQSTHFLHIFGGGYAFGYYSYKWAEVMSADAFEYFLENGLFDENITRKLYGFLAAGATEDPLELYVKMRGQAPDMDALLRLYGLIGEDSIDVD